MTTIAVADLTSATLAGTGVFDVLMRANKTHLEAEFSKNRIKGAEYATVYLGSLTQVMQTALQFLLTKEKADLEAQLLQKQILLAQAQIDKTASEKLQVEAQTLLINQQKANLLAEGQNIPKQGLMIDAQTAVQTQQKLNLVSEELGIDARTDLTVQQKTNAVTENTVLVAQECKLRAEYDLIVGNVLKAAQETSLLTQKVATERAQITALGVDADSVVGRQKALYVAQTDGFKRDAEQKAAKLMVDTWNVRRTTDDTIIAGVGVGGVDNRLGDIDVGRAVAKLLTGVGAI